MTKSSKKSAKTSASPLHTREEDSSSRDNMPRTQAGTLRRTGPTQDDEKESSSSVSSRASSRLGGNKSGTDSFGRSQPDDPKDDDSDNSPPSTKKSKRRRQTKKSKKKREEEESEGDQFGSELDPTEWSEELFRTQIGDALKAISDQVQALTVQVNQQAVAMSKPKDNVEEVNPFLQQLASATQEVDWRDIIIKPKKLHLGDLSANNQVDRSNPDAVGSDDVTTPPLSNANVSPINNQKDSSPNRKPPNRVVHTAHTQDTDTLDTYISKVYNDLDSSTLAASRNRVVIMRQEKECTIRIRKLELGTVATAARAILEFQEVEQTPVNMMKVLDPSVRDYLKIKYRVSPADLASWNISDLFQIMGRETVVSNQIAFYEQLKLAMSDKKVMPWSAVTPQNHERFYLQQVRFVEEFKTVLKLMLAGNKKHCPPIKLKKNGLLKLFSDLNNPEYFEHVYTASLHSRKFDNMFTFLDQYLKVAHQHYQMSIIVKDLPYNFNEVHKSKQKSLKQEAYYHTKRDINKQLDKKTNYNFSKSSSRTSQRSSTGYNRDKKELNHITSTIDDDDDYDVWRNVEPEGQSQDYQDEDSVSVASNETKSDDEDDNDQDDDANANDDFDQQLAAMESSNHPSSVKNNSSSNRAPYACLKKILTGKCDKPNCQYDHNPHRLREAAQDVVSKANDYLKTQNSKPASNKPTLMVRDKGKF